MLYVYMHCVHCMYCSTLGFRKLKSLLDQSLEVAAFSLYAPPFFFLSTFCVCMHMKRGHWCHDRDCVPQPKEIEGSVLYVSVQSRDGVPSAFAARHLLPVLFRLFLSCFFFFVICN